MADSVALWMSGRELFRRRGRRLAAAVLATAVVFATAGVRLATAGGGTVGRAWPAAKRVSVDHISHAPLNGLLKKYVDADGYVAYAAWKASRDDRQKLLTYLASLGQADPHARATRQAKLAFWINAYNALTIEGILREYPTSSIRNHTARLFGYNIWHELLLVVGDKKYSLDHIEHQILRKMNEPRIHFAIVCASIGCPRLRSEAYTASRVSEQLADNARDFFSRPQNFRVDMSPRTLFVSSIMDWFAEDFGTSTARQLATVKAYLPSSAQQLVDRGGVRVRYLDYNWDLNDQKSRR
ncbi:MAG: DUF547 domain-containing protein [Planctomycetota bacterium]